MATQRWISTGSGAWTSTSNWSGGAVPTSGDTVVFEKNDVDLAAYDASAVTNVTLLVHQSYTGKIGDVDNYLQLGCSSVEIGRDDENLRPAGSSRINLDVGTVASTITVLQTAMNPADTGYSPVRLLANSATTDVYVRKGKVALAGFTGETSTIDDFEIGESGGSDSNTQVVLGSGCTIDDGNIRSGKVTARCNLGDVNIYGGTLCTEGSGTVATCNVRGGNLIANSTGTITTLRVQNGGQADFQQNNRARTVTNISVYKNSRVRLHPSVTLTNGIVQSGETPLDIVVS